MAGNNKPRKKYNPKKRELQIKHGQEPTRKSHIPREPLDIKVLSMLNEPIDKAIWAMHAGTASAVDWHNVMYRAYTGIEGAKNGYTDDVVHYMQDNVTTCLAIRERAIKRHKLGSTNIWQITDEELGELLTMHATVNDMFKEMNPIHILSAYRRVQTLMDEHHAMEKANQVPEVEEMTA